MIFGQNEVLEANLTSKHLLRRYLDPKNIPQTPSQEVFGCLGLHEWLIFFFVVN